MDMKPLFIPLKKEYFEEFEHGEKTTEYRQYGPHWNERTCTPGRPVILSCGYSKHRRLKGIIKDFRKVPVLSSKDRDSYQSIYGTNASDQVAEIDIELTDANVDIDQ
jgi:hypothetical protein